MPVHHVEHHLGPADLDRGRIHPGPHTLVLTLSGDGAMRLAPPQIAYRPRALGWENSDIISIYRLYEPFKFYASVRNLSPMVTENCLRCDFTNGIRGMVEVLGAEQVKCYLSYVPPGVTDNAIKASLRSALRNGASDDIAVHKMAGRTDDHAAPCHRLL